jgi:putative flippase GtrA
MLQIRYVTIGVLNFLISFIIFASLMQVLQEFINYLTILVLSFFINVPISHLNQRIFVWKSKNRYLPELQKFFMVNLPPFLFNWAVLPLLVEIWDLPIIPTQLITGGLIILGTFVVHKTWTFK